MRRRTSAVKRNRNEDARIPPARPALEEAPNPQLDSPRTTNTWPGRIVRIQQRVNSGRKHAQMDQRNHCDGEKILFRFLAFFGAALVVIAYVTLNPRSAITFSRFIKRPPFLSDGMDTEGYTVSHLNINRAVPQLVEFSLVNSGMDNSHDLDAFEVDKTNHFRDFGGLELGKMGDSRHIIGFLDIDPTIHQPNFIHGHDYYYNFDDDYQRNPFNGVNEELEDYHEEEQCCRMTSEHRLQFSNCNTFHEISMLQYNATHLGSGEYREAFRMELPLMGKKETIVMKDMSMSLDTDFYILMEFARIDALVSERLTASPRISNIFGGCGIGLISELLPHGHLEEIAIPYDDIDFSKEDGSLTCYNDLPILWKLEASLQMAEALADLHGYREGPIVHSDMKLDQYFFNADKSKVILSDFSRAEFLLWDHCNEKYCEYRNGVGAGNMRAPEEYLDDFLTEKVDVYSLGNNIYGLLTGLMPYQERVEHWSDAWEPASRGEKVFIDPRYKDRSLAEAKLVEIIERCHELDPEHRPSIFEVVEFLRDALQEVTDAMDNGTDAL